MGNIARIDVDTEISIGLRLCSYRYNPLCNAGSDCGELRIAVEFVVQQGGLEGGS